MKAYEGMQAWLPTFLTLVLGGGEKSFPYSRQFTAEVPQYVTSVPGLLKTLLITYSEYISINRRN
jgi:hypothetical protein